MPPAFPPQALLMTPYFSPRPWGGDRLCTLLGKRPPAPESDGQWIGESWELSDHPHGHSRIAGGPLAGLEFGEAMRRHPLEMCGLEVPPARYPLLVKFVDAGEDLSIQVHPDDAQAAEEGDRGKAECWYVVDCAPQVEIVHGLAAGVDAAALRRAAEAGDFAPCTRRQAIRRGDFLNTPPGTVHAILAGTLLCEIQRASDVTYRLWDYDRQPARPLHVEQALRATRFDAPESRARDADRPTLCHTDQLAPGLWPLLKNDYFLVVLGFCPPGDEAHVELKNPSGIVLCVVEGGGSLAWPDAPPCELAFGQTWYLTPGLTQWRVAAGPRGLRVLLARTLEI